MRLEGWKDFPLLSIISLRKRTRLFACLPDEAVAIIALLGKVFWYNVFILFGWNLGEHKTKKRKGCCRRLTNQLYGVSDRGTVSLARPARDFSDMETARLSLGEMGPKCLVTTFATWPYLTFHSAAVLSYFLTCRSTYRLIYITLPPNGGASKYGVLRIVPGKYRSCVVVERPSAQHKQHRWWWWLAVGSACEFPATSK